MNMKIIHKYKSKGLTIQLFEIPIYDSRICFIRYENNKSYDKAVDWLETIGLKDETYKTDEYRYAYGFTDKQKTKYGIIHLVFMNNCKEYKPTYKNTLAHENFHLVHNICKHHGIDFLEDNANEPYAYLTGYLFDILFTI
jgi:hypothetical protein